MVGEKEKKQNFCYGTKKSHVLHQQFWSKIKATRKAKQIVSIALCSKSDLLSFRFQMVNCKKNRRMN